MRFKSIMLRRLSQCFLTNMPQMSQKRAVLLSPPLALRKAGGRGGWVEGLWWLEHSGWVPLTSCSILFTQEYITNIIAFQYVLWRETTGMQWVKESLLQFPYDSMSPTYFSSIGLNYSNLYVLYFSHNELLSLQYSKCIHTSGFGIHYFLVSDVTLVLLQPLRQTLTILQDSVPKSHM